MAFTTFAGPVRVGTVKDGAVTSRNTGLAVLSQTATVAFGAIKQSPSAQNLFTLPAGSKILNFIVDVTTALSTATNCGVTLGKAGTADYFSASFNTSASAVRVAQSVVDTAIASKVVALDNVGTSDLTVQGTFTAATADATAGAIKVTCVYVQRDAAGNANPTSV